MLACEGIRSCDLDFGEQSSRDVSNNTVLGQAARIKSKWRMRVSRSGCPALSPDSRGHCSDTWVGNLRGTQCWQMALGMCCAALRRSAVS